LSRRFAPLAQSASPAMPALPALLASLALSALPALLVSLALSALPAAAQTPAGALLERQLRAAQELEKDGQADAARQAFQQVVDAAPDGPQAPDALLGLARLAWPVDDPARVGAGAVDPRVLEAARAPLETIRKKFASSPAAPEALWRLALLRLEPSAPDCDLEQALALVTTLPTVYPNSPRAAEALALAARLQLEAGRPERARGQAFRLLAEWPEHKSAAQAFVVLGLAAARAGRTEEALAMFGRARVVAEGRDPAAAAAASSLAAALDRVAFSATRGARPLEIDRAAQPVVFPGKAKALRALPDGGLVAAIPSEGQIVAAGGAAAGGGKPLPDVLALTLDRWGRLWAANEQLVAPPPGAGSLPLPERTEVVAIAAAGPRGLWVADGRGRRVVRLEAGKGIVATARLPERADPLSLAGDGQGGVWVLDGRSASLIDVAEDGSARATIALGAAAKDPVSVDRDELGDLYVLDADAPALLIFDVKGKLAVRQPLPTEGDQGFSKPTLIAVDRAGAVAVFDARKKRAVWMR